MKQTAPAYGGLTLRPAARPLKLITWAGSTLMTRPCPPTEASAFTVPLLLRSAVTVAVSYVTGILLLLQATLHQVCSIPAMRQFVQHAASATDQAADGQIHRHRHQTANGYAAGFAESPIGKKARHSCSRQRQQSREFACEKTLCQSAITPNKGNSIYSKLELLMARAWAILLGLFGMRPVLSVAAHAEGSLGLVVVSVLLQLVSAVVAARCIMPTVRTLGDKRCDSIQQPSSAAVALEQRLIWILAATQFAPVLTAVLAQLSSRPGIFDHQSYSRQYLFLQHWITPLLYGAAVLLCKAKMSQKICCCLVQVLLAAVLLCLEKAHIPTSAATVVAAHGSTTHARSSIEGSDNNSRSNSSVGAEVPVSNQVAVHAVAAAVAQANAAAAAKADDIVLQRDQSSKASSSSSSKEANTTAVAAQAQTAAAAVRTHDSSPAGPAGHNSAHSAAPVAAAAAPTSLDAAALAALLAPTAAADNAPTGATLEDSRTFDADSMLLANNPEFAAAVEQPSWQQFLQGTTGPAGSSTGTSGMGPVLSFDDALSACARGVAMRTQGRSALYRSTVQHHLLSVKVEMPYTREACEFASAVAHHLHHTPAPLVPADAPPAAPMMLMSNPLVVRGCFHILLSVAAPAAGSGGFTSTLEQLISQLPAGSRVQRLSQHDEESAAVNADSATAATEESMLLVQIDQQTPMLVTRQLGGPWRVRKQGSVAPDAAKADCSGTAYGCWLQQPCVRLAAAGAAAAGPSSSGGSNAEVFVRGIPAAAGPVVRVVVVQGPMVMADLNVQVQQLQDGSRAGHGTKVAANDQTEFAARVKLPQPVLKPGPALIYVLSPSSHASNSHSPSSSQAAPTHPVTDISNARVWACLPLLLVGSTTAEQEFNTLYNNMCKEVAEQAAFQQLQQQQGTAVGAAAGQSASAAGWAAVSSGRDSLAAHVYLHHWQAMLWDMHYAVHATDVKCVDSIAAMVDVLRKQPALTAADITSIPSASRAAAAGHSGAVAAQGSGTLGIAKRVLAKEVLALLRNCGLHQAVQELQQQLDAANSTSISALGHTRHRHTMLPSGRSSVDMGSIRSSAAPAAVSDVSGGNSVGGRQALRQRLSLDSAATAANAARTLVGVTALGCTVNTASASSITSAATANHSRNSIDNGLASAMPGSTGAAAAAGPLAAAAATWGTSRSLGSAGPAASTGLTVAHAIPVGNQAQQQPQYSFLAPVSRPLTAPAAPADMYSPNTSTGGGHAGASNDPQHSSSHTTDSNASSAGPNFITSQCDTYQGVLAADPVMTSNLNPDSSSGAARLLGPCSQFPASMGSPADPAAAAGSSSRQHLQMQLSGSHLHSSSNEPQHNSRRQPSDEYQGIHHQHQQQAGQTRRQSADGNFGSASHSQYYQHQPFERRRLADVGNETFRRSSFSIIHSTVEPEPAPAADAGISSPPSNEMATTYKGSHALLTGPAVMASPGSAHMSIPPAAVMASPGGSSLQDHMALLGLTSPLKQTQNSMHPSMGSTSQMASIQGHLVGSASGSVGHSRPGMHSMQQGHAHSVPNLLQRGGSSGSYSTILPPHGMQIHGMLQLQGGGTSGSYSGLGLQLGPGGLQSSHGFEGQLLAAPQATGNLHSRPDMQFRQSPASLMQRQGATSSGSSSRLGFQQGQGGVLPGVTTNSFGVGGVAGQQPIPLAGTQDHVSRRSFDVGPGLADTSRRSLHIPRDLAVPHPSNPAAAAAALLSPAISRQQAATVSSPMLYEFAATSPAAAAAALLTPATQQLGPAVSSPASAAAGSWNRVPADYRTLQVSATSPVSAVVAPASAAVVGPHGSAVMHPPAATAAAAPAARLSARASLEQQTPVRAAADTVGGNAQQALADISGSDSDAFVTAAGNLLSSSMIDSYVQDLSDALSITPEKVAAATDEPHTPEPHDATVLQQEGTTADTATTAANAANPQEYRKPSSAAAAPAGVASPTAAAAAHKDATPTATAATVAAASHKDSSVFRSGSGTSIPASPGRKDGGVLRSGSGASAAASDDHRWHVFDVDDAEGFAGADHVTGTNHASRAHSTAVNSTTWFAIPTNSAANLLPPTPSHRSGALYHHSTSRTPLPPSARKRYNSSSGFHGSLSGFHAHGLFSDDHHSSGHGGTHAGHSTQHAPGSVGKLLTPQQTAAAAAHGRTPNTADRPAAAPAGHDSSSSHMTPNASKVQSRPQLSSQRRLMLFSPVRNSGAAVAERKAMDSMRNLSSLGLQQQQSEGAASGSAAAGHTQAAVLAPAAVAAAPPVDSISHGLSKLGFGNPGTSSSSKAHHTAEAAGMHASSSNNASSSSAAAALPPMMRGTPRRSAPTSGQHILDITRTPARPPLPSGNLSGFSTPQRGGPAAVNSTPRRPISSTPSRQAPPSPMAAPGMFNSWASNLGTPQGKKKPTVSGVLELLSGQNAQDTAEPGSAATAGASAGLRSGQISPDSSDDEFAGPAYSRATGVRATPSRGGYFTPVRPNRAHVDFFGTPSRAGPPSASRHSMLAAAAAGIPGRRRIGAAASPYVGAPSPYVSGPLCRSGSVLPRIPSSQFGSIVDSDSDAEQTPISRAGRQISGALFAPDGDALAAGLGLTGMSNVLSRDNSIMSVQPVNWPGAETAAARTTSSAFSTPSNSNDSNTVGGLDRQPHLQPIMSGVELSTAAAGPAADPDEDAYSTPVHTPPNHSPIGTPPDQIMCSLDNVVHTAIGANVYESPGRHIQDLDAPRQTRLDASRAAGSFASPSQPSPNNTGLQHKTRSSPCMGDLAKTAEAMFGGGLGAVGSSGPGAGGASAIKPRRASAPAVQLTPPPAPARPLPSVMLVPACETIASEAMFTAEYDYFDEEQEGEFWDEE